MVLSHSTNDRKEGRVSTDGDNSLIGFVEIVYTYTKIGGILLHHHDR